MAVLSKEKIEKKREDNELVVRPILDEKVQIEENPASLDLRLDNYFGEFKTRKESQVDLQNPNQKIVNFSEISFDDYYILHSGEFVLAQSFEWVALPNDLIGVLSGRSSLGRQGLLVHSLAGYVDPTFKGHITFELTNVGKMPIKLYPLMRVCRLTLQEIEKSGKYQGRFDFQIKANLPKEADPDLEKIRTQLDN